MSRMRAMMKWEMRMRALMRCEMRMRALMRLEEWEMKVRWEMRWR